jgi:ankyrin repeat protein
MAAQRSKRLPWTYHEALGPGRKRLDEARAKAIVQRVGLHACNDLGDTPLTVAAMLGRTDMVRWLLAQGADVNAVAANGEGQPPLCAAAYWKQPEVAAILIEAGANLEATDRFNHTPLANAFINCFTDPLPLAGLLIAAGAAITDRVIYLGNEWNAEAFQAFLRKYPPGKKRARKRRTYSLGKKENHG